LCFFLTKQTNLSLSQNEKTGEEEEESGKRKNSSCSSVTSQLATIKLLSRACVSLLPLKGNFSFAFLFTTQNFLFNKSKS
jgi:hypothetical protein